MNYIKYNNEDMNEELCNMQIIIPSCDLHITMLACAIDKNDDLLHIGPYLKIMRYLNDRHEVTHCCRISMLNPNYIVGFDENMMLTKNEKAYIIQVLNSKIDIFNGTGWDMSITYINEYVYFENKKYSIPNYELLKTED